MTNWFNPDIRVYGRYDKKALKHSESLEQTPRDFDPRRDCPYDKTLCRQKLVYLNMLTDAIKYAEKNHCDMALCTSNDRLNKCPVPMLNCIRQARYEIICQENKRQK